VKLITAPDPDNKPKADNLAKPAAWSPRISRRVLPSGAVVWIADWWEKRTGGGYTHRRKQVPTRVEIDDWVAGEAKRLKAETNLLRKAERRGDNVITLSNLSPLERASLVRAVETIRKEGGRLEAIEKAASVYAEAYLTGAKITVATLRDEHLKNLEQLGKRPPTIRDRRLYLAPFVETNGDRLAATVTRQQAEAWILEADTVSKQASRYRALHALFRFGVRRKYFPENPVADLDKPPERPPDRVDIFSPAETESVLRAAQEREPRLVPYLAVGMFGGLRPQNELARLDWSDINLETGKITVTRSTSKTDRVRHVDIQPNLRAWLVSVPRSQRRGKIYYSRRALFKVLGRTWPEDRRKAERATKEAQAGRLGHKLPGPKPVSKAKPKGRTLRWGPDIMRHSFCTYRQAVLRDIGKLCFEAGNTEAVARAHYLNPRVSEAEVNKFWAIMPTLKGGSK
jgi:integrase